MVTLAALDRFRDLASAGPQALERVAMALTMIRNVNSLPDGPVCQKILGKMIFTLVNGSVLAVKSR